MPENEHGGVAVDACLAIHGLGGGPWEIEPLILGLQAAGVFVEAITLPGHDDPGPRMPHSERDDWMAAVEQAFDRLASQHGRVAVIGFSTGGTLALWLASRRAVDRLVLLAPFLAIRHTSWLGHLARGVVWGIARVCPDLPRRHAPVRDRQMRERFTSMERFRTFSMPSTLSALDLIAHVKPLVPSIVTPTLILQGRRDSVVEPRGGEWLYRHLGSDRKALVWLDDSDHLVALDEERTTVISRVVSFLRGGEFPTC